MCQEKSDQYISIELGGSLVDDRQLSCFSGFAIRQHCKGQSFDEYFAKDAKIEIPEGGITLKHGDDVIADIEAPNVEVVWNKDGAILYLTVNDPAAYAELLRLIEGD